MPVTQRRRSRTLITTAVAVAVIALLLVPVHPEAGVILALASILPSGALAGGSPGWWTFEDVGNIALFVPVGFMAARYLRPGRALVVGIALSALCETLQLVIPSRHGSLQDVLMNSIGVALGVTTTLAVGRALRRRQASATSPHSVQVQ